MAERIRFGIIGCSDIAKRKTIPAILNSNHASLHMLGSRSKEKAAQWASEYHSKFSGTYEDVIENDEIDAVYISLPFELQSEWLKKAANSKKHIICEKSITTSYESAKTILDYSKKNKIRILEAFSFRFHPQHKKTQELISNEAENFDIFEAKFGFVSKNKNEFRFNPKLGGSGLNDMGCYAVCASRMSFNQEPESVACNFIIDPESKIDLKGNFILFFSNGKTAFGSYSYDNFYQSTYSIWGKTSLIELPRAYAIKPHVNSHILIHTDDGINDIEIPWVDQSQEMIDEFCRVIKNEINSSFDYEMDFLLQAKVLEALRISSKEKRLVKLNELN